MQSLRVMAAAAAHQADIGEVDKALKAFPRGSAPGPTGLRPQHLKDALAPGLRDEVLRQTTKLVNLMARGEAPPDVQQWLCGASLVAIPKPSMDLRPVAVGETWRRLTAKTLAAAIAPGLREHLEPIQVGVGTSGGAEAIVHTVRQLAGQERERGPESLAHSRLAKCFLFKY